MRKILLFFLIALCFLPLAQSISAQSPLSKNLILPQESFVKAKVITIVKEDIQNIDGFKNLTQTISVQILEGPEKNKTIIVTNQADVRLAKSEKITQGMIVILDVLKSPGKPATYTITDIYRLPMLLYAALLFFAFILLVAGKKGFGATLGLFISLCVIIFFILPAMLHGFDPLLVSFVGCTIILLATTYIAHGFSRQTTLAVVATFASLVVTCLFAILAVKLAHLAGLGSDDAYLLEVSPNVTINPQGLLLGGILIGTLGALNDVTTTQVASIFGLYKANPMVKITTLIEEGFLIGREHIVSLINTLVLAYAGSSLVIFVFFVLNPNHLPWWVIINNESSAEEIIRTIAGSVGLILSVPVVTVLASWWITNRGQSKTQ